MTRKRDDWYRRSTRRERVKKRHREPEDERSEFDRLEEGFHLRRDDLDAEDLRRDFDLPTDGLWDAD